MAAVALRTDEPDTLCVVSIYIVNQRWSASAAIACMQMVELCVNMWNCDESSSSDRVTVVRPRQQVSPKTVEDTFKKHFACATNIRNDVGSFATYYIVAKPPGGGGNGGGGTSSDSEDEKDKKEKKKKGKKK